MQSVSGMPGANLMSATRAWSWTLLTFSLLLQGVKSWSVSTLPAFKPCALRSSTSIARRMSPRLGLRMESADVTSKLKGSWALFQAIEGEGEGQVFVNLEDDFTATTPLATTENKGEGMQWGMQGEDFILSVPKKSALCPSDKDRAFFGTLKEVLLVFPCVQVAIAL
eukprot:1814954-Rhodomonas_salina.1